MKILITILLMASATVLLGQSNYGLSLNGTTQYVTCATNSALDIADGGALTIEGWIYPTASSGNIVTRTGYGYGLMLDAGKVLFWDQGSQASAKKSTGSVTLNKWQHIAVTVTDNGSNLTIRFYINGVADAGNPQTSTQTQINNGTGTKTLDFGIQDRAGCACNFYAGRLDEFRFWNTARTQSEIQNYYLRDVHTSSTGLIAYYKFDDGSGTTLTESKNAINGTLTNSPSWVVSGANVLSDHPAGNSIKFDGTNDYVSVPTASQINFGSATDFTLEAWVKFSASQSDYAGIVVKATTGSPWTGYQMVLVGNKIAAEIGNGTTFVGVSGGLQGTTTLNNGNWHHLALVATRASNNVKLYVDGTQEASVNNALFSNNLDNSASMYIGTERTPTLYFNGQIDEVRVWNTARSSSDISTYKSTVIAPSTANLVAYYRFDQGISSGTNTSLTSVLDLTSYANNGTLNNSALSGSTSNWIAASNTALPVELSSFSAVKSGNAVQLLWRTETEINNAKFYVESSKDKTEWKAIGFVGGQGTTYKPSDYSYTDNRNVTGKVYYRLKQVDNDGSFTYSNIAEIDLGKPASFSLEQNHPNPFNPETVINFSTPEDGLVTLKIYNALGQEVVTVINKFMNAGSHTHTFRADNLKSGVYFYTLTSGKFTQTKKFILAK